MMLVEKIGKAAMLEQTAEECTELAQACLKMARHYRGVNPAYKEFEELKDNLAEEMADIQICMNELEQGNIITEDDVLIWIKKKIRRMIKRMVERGKL